MSSTSIILFDGSWSQTWAGMLSAVGSLPLSTHAIAIAALLAGLWAWAFGHRTIKLASAVLGVIWGASVGMFAFAPLAASLGIHPAFLAAAMAVLGLISAMLMFRGLVSGACALLFGLAVPTILVAVLEFTDAPSPEETRVPTASDVLSEQQEEDLRTAKEVADVLGITPDTSAGALDPALQSAADRVSGFMEELWETLEPRWQALPQARQLAAILGAIFGVIVGFSMGMLMTNTGARIATLAFGAAAWLFGGVWLLELMNATPTFLLERSAPVWLAVWAGVCMIGIVIRATVKTKPKASKENEA
ncbi:MAG: hypothetical protein AAGB34_11145 [Planctomycetota bacterium]